MVIVVCCSLFVVYCSMCVARCVLFVVCSSVCAVCCLLLVVWVFVVCSLLIHV